MTEPADPAIQAAIEIGGLFATRWERREMEPVLKEEVAAIINKHLQHAPDENPYIPPKTCPKGGPHVVKFPDNKCLQCGAYL